MVTGSYTSDALMFTIRGPRALDPLPGSSFFAPDRLLIAPGPENGPPRLKESNWIEKHHVVGGLGSWKHPTLRAAHRCRPSEATRPGAGRPLALPRPPMVRTSALRRESVTTRALEPTSARDSSSRIDMRGAPRTPHRSGGRGPGPRHYDVNQSKPELSTPPPCGTPRAEPIMRGAP